MKQEDIRMLIQSDLNGVAHLLEGMEGHPDPDGRRNLFHRAQMRLTAARLAAEADLLTEFAPMIQKLQSRLMQEEAAAAKV